MFSDPAIRGWTLCLYLASTTLEMYFLVTPEIAASFCSRISGYIFRWLSLASIQNSNILKRFLPLQLRSSTSHTQVEGLLKNVELQS
jgi:hypothetical protein